MDSRRIITHSSRDLLASARPRPWQATVPFPAVRGGALGSWSLGPLGFLGAIAALVFPGTLDVGSKIEVSLGDPTSLPDTLERPLRSFLGEERGELIRVRSIDSPEEPWLLTMCCTEYSARGMPAQISTVFGAK